MIYSLLAFDFLGASAYADALRAIVVLSIFIIAAKIVDFILITTLRKAASRTKSTLDDKVLKRTERPIMWGIILAGINTSLYVLSAAQPYLPIIQKVFSVIWILWGLILALRLVDTALHWYLTEMTGHKIRAHVDSRFVPIMRKLVNGFIYAIAIILILQKSGIEITPLVAGLGIGGLAVALALQETLANFFSGTYLITEGSVKIGDYVEIGPDLKGIIKDIGWRSSKIQTVSNNMIIIPNAKLSQSVITNYNAPEQQMSVVVPCGVAYGSDLEKVERIAKKAAKKIIMKSDGGVKDFDPLVRFREFGDSNINFNTIFRVRQYRDKWALTHEFIKELTKEFKKEKIEISWPVRKVYNYKGK